MVPKRLLLVYQKYFVKLVLKNNLLVINFVKLVSKNNLFESYFVKLRSNFVKLRSNFVKFNTYFVKFSLKSKFTISSTLGHGAYNIRPRWVLLSPNIGRLLCSICLL